MFLCLGKWWTQRQTHIGTTETSKQWLKSRTKCTGGKPISDFRAIPLFVGDASRFWRQRMFDAMYFEYSAPWSGMAGVYAHVYQNVCFNETPYNNPDDIRAPFHLHGFQRVPQISCISEVWMVKPARQHWQIGQHSGFYTGEGDKSTGSSQSSPEKSSADGVMSPLLHLGCSMLRSRQTFSSVELRRGKEISESLDQHQSQGCLYHIFRMRSFPKLQ